MPKDVDLDYVPSTLLGPLDTSEVEKVRTGLSRAGVYVEFDDAYIRHLSTYHGGVPGKGRFLAVNNVQYSIERFLHFAAQHHDDNVGWYNLAVSRSLIAERLNEFLVPFAFLFAGDYVCFDTEYEGRPRIVVWLNGQSPPGHPKTEYVADNFDTFLRELY